MGLRGRGFGSLGNLVSGGLGSGLLGTVIGGPVGGGVGALLGGGGIEGAIEGGLLGGIVGGPAGGGIGGLLGSGGEIGGLIGNLGDLVGGITEGIKGDKEKIDQIPLAPELQKVVERGRQIQLDELNKVAGLSTTDLSDLNRRALEGQKLRQELGQVPRLTQLRSQELGATAGISDARRRLRERIAQKGLGSSSIGLAAERSLGRRQGRLFEGIKAQREGLARERDIGSRAIDLSSPANLRRMRLENIQRTAGITGGILGQPGARPGQVVSGGQPGLLSTLAPLAGAGIGGLLSQSPAGAQVGLGVGQAASPLLR